MGRTMRFESRVFTLAKDPEHPEQNQDACCLDSARGLAAIADGVATGIFSRQWAALLAEAVVADVPNPDDPEAFASWLAERRRGWSQSIDVSQLAWYQKPKLREGAFSTLLWVHLLPEHESASGPQQCWRMRVFAVGDSCLWHLRGCQTLRTFPVEKAEQLEVNPVVVGSVDLGRDAQIRFQHYEDRCQPGDLLVLCTDAIAAWALRRAESGHPPRWEEYWDMPRAAWQAEITRLREEGHMRYDDATLMLLRVTDGRARPSQTEPAARATAADGTTLSEGPAIGEDSQEAQLQPAGDKPPPAADIASEWKQKAKEISEQVSDQLSEGVTLGWRKIKQWARSTESAIRKYRQKNRDKPPDD
ncbi:MAG TPA: hypothetical protein EYP56_23120 [Planctomycetaceae bacterium]|nr:hypothetical protein [Planctomycetaceae bacterium]